MERNVHRINGIKTHLDALSDDELNNLMLYTHERIERASDELETLGIESARRFAVAETTGEVILNNVYPIHPGQGVLDGFDGPTAA